MIPVWTYWEGRQPPWVGLCLETIARNIPGVTVLDPDLWNAIYDGAAVPREWIDRQAPNVKSDFIRAWLLHNLGGIWVDADFIAFRDVRPIWRRLRRNDFVAYRAKAGRAVDLCSALIASKPGGVISAGYLEQMVSILQRNDGKRLSRNMLGPSTLRRAVRGHRDKLALIPTRLVHPWCFWMRLQKRELATEGSDEALASLLSPRAFGFMLTHRALGRWRKATREELLEAPILPAVCWRRALGLR